jgi:hypothetical protein
MRRLTWKQIIALLILLLQAVSVLIPTLAQQVEPPTSFVSDELGHWASQVKEFWLGLFQLGEKESQRSTQKANI